MNIFVSKIMAGLENVFPEDNKYASETFDELPMELKAELLVNIYGKVRDMLINAKSPSLQKIGWNLVSLMSGEATPLGITQMLTVDSLMSFYSHLQLMGVPPLNDDPMANKIFRGFETELSNPDNLNPPVYSIFAPMPIMKSELDKYGAKLTKFNIISHVIINASSIKEIQNPRQIVYYLVYAMSYISDCIKLLEDMKNGMVYFGAIEMVHRGIVDRAVSASKTAIIEMNERFGVESFAGLNKISLDNMRTVDNLDEMPEIETLYHFVPGINNN